MMCSQTQFAPQPSLASGPSDHLRRMCDCGQHTIAGSKCSSCSEERKGSLQRSALSRDSTQGHDSVVPPIVHDVLNSPGQPLDAATRAFFEPRFGYDFTRVSSSTAPISRAALKIGPANDPLEQEADNTAETVLRTPVSSASASSPQGARTDFSRVRIHTDTRAADSARAVNAKAYTVRQNIVFGPGGYAPHTEAGRKLLAHELTHTLQQSGAASGATARLQRTIGDEHDLRSPRFSGDAVLEACFDNERFLRSGDSGPAVRKVQQALVDAGFPLPVFGVDGIFESETQTAVRNYQRARGLAPDGIVGPITMGTLDGEFAAPGPLPPAPAPPAPAPPGPVPAPPGPAPAPPGPAPAPPGPAPAPPGPAPAPPGPAPAPPGPAPAPPETITSETVALTPGVRTRTKIGVGEDVTLTHAPGGAAAWSAPLGTFSIVNGPITIFTAPDTAQARLTVTGGTATKDFEVVAPTSVAMDREPGTGMLHTLNRPDSGIRARVFLGPDTVNFNKVIYHEMDVAGTGTGVFSCNPAARGHCGAGGGGVACPDKTVTSTVVAGKGTQSTIGDCALSGDCCGAATPFVAGAVTLSIPYEYKVGAGAFHAITNVPQVHALAADLTTLTSDKAGAHGDTTVATASSSIVGCSTAHCP